MSQLPMAKRYIELHVKHAPEDKKTLECILEVQEEKIKEGVKL